MVPTNISADDLSLDQQREERDRRNRFFQRTMHEDGIFNQCLNFFMVFESLLIARVATLYAASRPPSTRSFAWFGAFGIAVTVLWIYAQWRQLVILRVLVDQFEEVALEVKQTRVIARGTHRGPRIGSVLAFGVPGLVF